MSKSYNQIALENQMQLAESRKYAAVNEEFHQVSGAYRDAYGNEAYNKLTVDALRHHDTLENTIAIMRAELNPCNCNGYNRDGCPNCRPQSDEIPY